MYYKLMSVDNEITGVYRHEEYALVWSIPFDPANTDYQQFKKDVANGVELQDPDGNVMTQAEVDAFLKTIP